MKFIALVSFSVSVLLSSGDLAAAPLDGKKILYVLNDGPHRAVDDAVKGRLESQGARVTVAEHDDPASDAEGHNLVMISATVSGYVQAATFRDSPVPVLVWESHIYDDLRLTGMQMWLDFGEFEPHERHLWLVNAPHPISAGHAAGLLNIYEDASGMGWGKPGPGADVIATLPGFPERAAVFAYEQGATMDYDFIAPARRVAFFTLNNTFTMLNENGLSLFDAAVQWSVSEPPQYSGN